MYTVHIIILFSQEAPTVIVVGLNDYTTEINTINYNNVLYQG